MQNMKNINYKNQMSQEQIDVSTKALSEFVIISETYRKQFSEKLRE